MRLSHLTAKKVMKTISQIVPVFLFCGLLVFVVSGCLGPQVLQETKVHVPAPDPNVELRLRTGTNADVLVVYDDMDPVTGKVKRRAFFLFANYERVNSGGSPQFVSPHRANKLPIVPIMYRPPFSAEEAGQELYAVATSERDFTLYSRGHGVADFGLPEYGQWLTAKKLFLFPGAVAADAVGLGAVLGAEAAASNPVGTANAVAGAVGKH